MFNFLKRNKVEKEEEYRGLGAGGSFVSLFEKHIWGKTDYNPLGISTAYRCIQIKSDKIASTPLKFYEKKGSDSIELTDHPLTKLLKRPSKYLTNFKWESMMMTNLQLDGNAYAVILRSDKNRAVELLPLEPKAVSIQQTTIESDPYFYRITFISGRTADIWPENIIHYHNFTLDGIKGISPIEKHRDTFESAKEQEVYNKVFIKNSTNISGVLETDKKIKKELADEIRKDFTGKFGGAENAGKTPVLQDGLTYKQLSVLSPLDTDYINTRKLSESEIAKIYGVPLSMIGDTNSKYSNAEQDSKKFNEDTMIPIQKMIAQELTLKLVPSYLENNTFFEFSPDPIKLSSAKDQSEIITQLKLNGIITANESREYYNLNKIKGGDELVIQLNTAPQSLVKEKMESEIKQINKPEPQPTNSTNLNEEKETEKDNTRNDSEVNELRKIIQKLSSDIGRIKKDIKN